MARIGLITAIAVLTTAVAAGAQTTSPEAPPQAAAPATVAPTAPPDTITAARVLIPLLDSLKARLRPRLGVGAGDPPPSPFTGTQTTVVSVGVGKRTSEENQRLLKGIEQLQRWTVGDQRQAAEAVLFDHWLGQLTLKATIVGLRDCDSACLVERFPKPDAAFGKSRREREETRDRLLQDALANAMDEVEAQR